ncbi:SWI/SNF complex subunit SMARCC2 isoform X2 [Contarinia nasturtii]|uniref:SWI/SNF complex subunit SMARCC2 isoform X2 n=1 Tax=Contarinia nasturtii TaxID=265458 RepID=UPI0012D3E791|nr:SWI/SNF complex subunit SMARCC2 isoform X2 [Contarinia nasturtii]
MALLGPKKDGGPNADYFQSPESMQGFEQVRQWLTKNCKKYVQSDPPTKESLSQLLISFIQFQETRFGKGASEPPTMRLPMRCFLDFKPGGSLCHIFSNMYRYKADQRWRKFEFNVTKTARKDKDPNIQMATEILENLIDQECFRLPTAYIRPEVEEELREQITEILKERQCEITEDEDQASHIIYPELDPLPDDYARPSFKRGKNVMIHWYYLPESYDSWVANTFELPEDVPESINTPSNTWRVTAQWVLHSQEYNEWMAEEDYEVDESGKKVMHRHRLTVDDLLQNDEKRTVKVAGKQKRKRSPSPPAKGVGKRKSGRSPAVVQKKARGNLEIEDEEDLTRDMDDPQPETNITEVITKPSTNSPATQSNSKQRGIDSDMLPLKGSVVADLDEEAERSGGSGTQNNVSGGGEDSQTGKTSENSNTQEFPSNRDDLEDNVTEQTHHIIVPSYSAWFDYNSIHVIEKRAMPEFFNAKNKSKTPEIYMAYRNFMIDTYRLNPTEYLTSTACRRNLAGDVCAIMRVHAFLEQWGLVNYQIDVDARPSPMGPPPTSHFHVLSDTPSGLQPLNPPKTTQPSAAKTLFDLDKVKKEKEVQVTVDGQIASAAPASVASSIAVNAAPVAGIAPPSAAAIAVGQVPIKPEISIEPGAHFGLRMDQYAKKPIAMRNKNAASMAREWTEQETFQLLEGLELFRDDWNKICEHVGTRTQDECILHFLRLPIEDPYLEDDCGFLGPLAYQPIPFSKSGNPIMSTVAFLSSIVDPRIAAAAAKAAMEEFALIKEEVPPNVYYAHYKNVEKSIVNGRFDPTAGLANSGIAGTAPEKEDEENKNNDEEMKDVSKKDGANESNKMDTSDKSGDAKTNEMAIENGATVNGSDKDSDETHKLFNETDLQRAAAAALASAAVKAKHMSALEERKIKSLVALLVETQMKKLEIKLRHFEELETTMEREREGLEYQRQQLITERQQFHLEQLKAAEFRARQNAQHRLQQEQQGQWQPPANANATNVPPVTHPLHPNVNGPHIPPSIPIPQQPINPSPVNAVPPTTQPSEAPQPIPAQQQPQTVSVAPSQNVTVPTEQPASAPTAEAPPPAAAAATPTPI